MALLIGQRLKYLANSPLGSFLVVVGVPILNYALPPHPALLALWIGVMLLFAQMLSPELSFSRLIASSKRKRVVLGFLLLGLMAPALEAFQKHELGDESLHLALIGASFGLFIASIALRVFTLWYPLDEDRVRFGPKIWR